jgi:hypothetical protein
MAIYNITGFQTAKTVSDMAVWANQTTNYAFAESFLVATFFIFLLVLKSKNDFDDSILASSFVCFILSLFLRLANLVSFGTVLIFLAILSITAFFVYKDNNPFR